MKSLSEYSYNNYVILVESHGYNKIPDPYWLFLKRRLEE
jgi:hypothetical protein